MNSKFFTTAAILLCFFIVGNIQGFGQETVQGKIIGNVLDANTGDPLPGANVMVKGTLLGAATDMEGRFSITRLPPGAYDVEASMMGYGKGILKEIKVSPGQTREITFRLETTVIQQPTLVITAAKRIQYIEDAPVSVDVVGRREIQARGVIELKDVIQNTAGIGLIKGQIDLRGACGFNWAAGSRVLLLVDGHPMITGDTGGINWDAIPIDEVERLEIVKGAGSALYGSNAIAGMVNIITRDPGLTPATRFKLSWGFYDKPAYENWRWTDQFLTHQISELGELDLGKALTMEGIDISHSRSIGNVGLLFTLGRKTSEGYHQNGDYSRWNALLKTKWKFSPHKTLTLTGNWSLNNHGDFLEWTNQGRALEVKPQKVGNWVRSEKGNLHLTFQHGVNRNFAYSIKANAYRYHFHNHFDDNTDYSTSDRIGIEAQMDYIWKNHSFTWGSEIINYYTNSTFYEDGDVWAFALYGEDEFKFASMTLSAGARYDYHEVVGHSADQQISPRVSLVFRPWEPTSLRLSAGYGFRAPSIAELFTRTIVSGFAVEPNPDLRVAERVWSYELGIRQALSFKFADKSAETSFLGNPFRWIAENLNPGLILDAAFFYSQYKNMIEPNQTYKPDSTVAIMFLYLDRARNRGFEARVRGNFFNGHLTANAGYTYVDPINLKTNKTLNYRSRHRVVLGTELKLWRLTFGWDYRYASRMDEIVNIDGSAFEERVPMHVMDARVVYDFGKLNLSLEGYNIRNYHYTLRQRYIEPIRHFMITLRGNI